MPLIRDKGWTGHIAVKMVDGADFATPETGIATNVVTGAYSKDGGARIEFDLMDVVGRWDEIDATDHPGVYWVDVTGGVTDTVGELIITIRPRSGSEYAACSRSLDIVSHGLDDIFDEVDGVIGQVQAVAPEAAAMIWNNVNAEAVYTAASFGQLIKDLSNVINNTGVSLGANALVEVEDACSAALQNLRLHTLLASQASLTVGSTTVLVSSVIGKILNKAPGVAWAYALATDSLEAIRDNQAGADVAAIADAVWDEASTGHVAAGKAGRKLWHKVSQIQASIANVKLSIAQARTDIGNLNDPTAGAIADAVWDEASTGHVAAGKAGYQLWTKIKAISNVVANEIEPSTDVISNYVKNNIEPSVNGISNIVNNQLEPSVNKISTAIEGISNAVINNIDPSVNAISNAIINNVDPSINGISNLVANELEPSVNKMSTAIEGISTAIINNIDPSVNGISNLVANEIEPSVNAISNAVINNIDPSINGISNLVANEIEPSVNAISTAIKGISNLVANNIDPSVNGISNLVANELEPSVNKMSTAIEGISTSIDGISNVVANEIEPSTDIISNYVKNNIEPSVNGISNIVQNVGVAFAVTSIQHASSHLLHQAHVTVGGKTGDFSTVAGSLRLARAQAIGDWTVAADALDVMDIDGTSQKSLGLLPGGGPYTSRA